MANILYFEGAGMDYKANEFSDVGNYRIRTAFTNLEGKQYYIELWTACRFKNRKTVFEWALSIGHLFNIADRDKEIYEMKRGKTDHLEIAKLDYTKKDITRWINENLNCNFDTIEVLDFLSGYRVHGENGGYNLIEDFEVNHDLALKRREVYKKIDMDYREKLNEKYSIIGLLEMDNESITIRCHASDKALGDLPRIKKVLL